MERIPPLEEMMRVTAYIICLTMLVFSGCSRTRAVKCAQQKAATPLFRIMEKGEYGYINGEGKVIVTPQFIGGQEFAEGIVAVICCKAPLTCPSHVAYFNCAGNLTFGNFEKGRPFSEGLAAVEYKGKWGYIDDSGKMVIEPQFVSTAGTAREFHEGLAAVPVGDKWGYINKVGKFVINPRRMIISLQQTPGISEFSEGLAAVNVNGKWGYIDKTGKLTIATMFDFAESFSEGIAAVSLAGKHGFIDKTGKWVIKPQFDAVWSFSAGSAPVQLSNKWGFIDKSGGFIIPLQFEDALPFSEGLAAVKVRGKYGYIDSVGKIMIQPQYDSAHNFTRGLAMIQMGTDPASVKTGYIDKRGKMIWKPTR